MCRAIGKKDPPEFYIFSIQEGPFRYLLLAKTLVSTDNAGVGLQIREEMRKLLEIFAFPSFKELDDTMAAEKGLHIAISAEKLFSLGNLEIANTLSTSLIVTAVLAAFLFYARTQLKETDTPTRFQSFLEMLVDGVYNLVHNVTESSKKTATFVPLIGSFLFFILLNNWVELLPGVHTIVVTGEPGVHLTDLPAWMNPDTAFAAETAEVAIAEDGSVEESTEEYAETEEKHGGSVALFRGANADLNMTLALAIISVVATQVLGISYVGLGYFKKFINLSDPISFFIGILEILAEFSKVISFAFRLFGNIFAGEVLIAVITFLIPVVVPVPFIGFEIFVGALQAYVFAMLSLVFFNMATSEHH